MEKIQVEILEKHRNYLKDYKPNDLYWGIGIENEVYLEFSKKYYFDNKDFYENSNRERYSVDYFSSYKPNVYKSHVNLLDLPNFVPILLNSHSFTKTDIKNEHQLTYEKIPRLNPKFSGKTLIDYLSEIDPYFKNEYMKSFIFDGDSIEFISKNFYKVTINDVIEELIENKNIFITKLKKIFKDNKIFNEFGEINICNKNHPFATFMTNFGKCSIFNNMTYHFNFTLPTKLDSKCNIINTKEFVEQHKNAIHLIQWIEPILLSLYGTGDPLSQVNNKLTNCSQRCAKSRYIGIGTYDTKTMIPGKLLLMDSEKNHLSNLNYWWYNKYYDYCSYKKEPQMGSDINFHKHKNHGIEIRIFDYFPEDKLEHLLKFFVLLFDYSLEYNVSSPIRNREWNDYTFKILIDKDYKLSEEIKITYKKLFNLPHLNYNSSKQLFDIIYNNLLSKYQNGLCYSKMIRKVESNQTYDLNTNSPTNTYSYKEELSEELNKLNNVKIVKQKRCCIIM